MPPLKSYKAFCLAKGLRYAYEDRVRPNVYIYSLCRCFCAPSDIQLYTFLRPVRSIRAFARIHKLWLVTRSAWRVRISREKAGRQGALLLFFARRSSRGPIGSLRCFTAQRIGKFLVRLTYYKCKTLDACNSPFGIKDKVVCVTAAHLYRPVL